MIRLAAVRLVNWYHFTDQTLSLAGSTLFLGDNGSGKSTVLDAIQWALVADLSQIRFNKAANELSRRTLHSYVRHKLGSEDESRPGQLRYGRGACTSHVILEFRDEADPGGDFVCGVTMEANESDSSVGRLHFLLPRATTAEVPVLAPGDLVRPLRELRTLLREMREARVFADVGTYREELRHRLGYVPETFHRLLVKALDFKPIGQVRQFVFDYLLDPRPVDTLALQSNLEHYKQLEAQARDAERRLTALDAICGLGERITGERRTAEGHRLLALRADLELAEDEERRVQRRLEDTEQDRHRSEAELIRLDEQLQFLDRERDRLTGLLLATPGFQQIQSLERDLERTRREIAEATEADTRARRILADQTRVLHLLLSQDARDLRQSRPALFAGEKLLGAEEEPEIVARLQEVLVREGALAGRDLGTWTRRLESSTETLRMALLRLRDAIEEAKREGHALDGERQELERGRLRYPDGAEALLHLLRTKLRGSREPRPLCEIIEVANPRWRDAVEGYLNTRRFDVLVAPEDFGRALSLYERNKRGYALPGRGEVFIASVGLVDMERVRAVAPRAERRSLSEQVSTDDDLARVYVDFLLGDVICCENEGELRRHRRAITDSVMVYQNHVARQTPPEVFGRHYIGEAARGRRLEEIGRRLAELAQTIIDLARHIDWLDAAVTACRKATLEIAELPRLVEEARRLADLRAQAVILERELKRIDRHEVEALEAERRTVEETRAQHTVSKGRLQTALGALVNEAGRLRDELARASQASTQRIEDLEEVFASARGVEPAEGSEAERRSTLEARYREERTDRSPGQVRDIFDRQARIIQSRVENLVQQLVQLKTEYANAHGLTAEVLGDGYLAFGQERELWQESHLPQYRERIREAKERAIQQLTEDIIFRLRENLVDVKRQIDELNRALKDVPFGSERYQFTMEGAPEHRAFYELIMEAGQFEKDSLFGAEALADSMARRTLEDLFERLIQAEARQVKTELEERADYREYFLYDLKILHADGTYSLYDRVAADKSGGETQNPYYIAVFASMARLYRSLVPEGRSRAGLVLLDEAFSKMDESRISATLRFARELGLQLVMATPKERSDLVAPSVETSLYIHKDPQSGVPTVLDFSKEFKRPEP